MTQPLADRPDGVLLVEAPDDGCWVATPCTLRVRATASGRLGRADPIVLTRPGGLEVLSLSPESSGEGRPGSRDDTAHPAAWLVRVIAFDNGEMSTPVLKLQVSTGESASQLVTAPTLTLHVQQPEVAPGTTLADIEGPLEVPMTLADAMATAGLLTALLVLTIALAWGIRRLLAVHVLRVRYGPGTGAISWRGAARALRRLRRRAARQAPPQVYSTMIEILRRTLMPRLGTLALSSTSSELVTLIQDQASVTLATQQLAPLLAMSDDVKFAGHRTSGDELVAACSRAIELVRCFERAGLTRASVPSQP
jgi:hypothetical protein